jgi:hypothetical protein
MSTISTMRTMVRKSRIRRILAGLVILPAGFMVLLALATAAFMR